MARLVVKTGPTFEAKNVPVKMQDGTSGDLDIVFNKIESARIDELFDQEDVRNSEIFEEIVHSVDGMELEVVGGPNQKIEPKSQKEMAAKDLAIVNHAVAHFFKLTRPATHANRTSRRQQKRG
jgi:Phage tail assembly chaperone